MLFRGTRQIDPGVLEMLPEQVGEHAVVFFDGVCNLCDGFVQFVIRRDPDKKVLFASLESDIGKRIQERVSSCQDGQSIILLLGNRVYIRSSAVIRILGTLSTTWSALYLLLAIPRPLRDFFYRLVARNRYRWFGKKSQCLIPTPDLKDRFLDGEQQS